MTVGGAVSAEDVEAHLGEELSLARLAEVACLSPWHFRRCFKQAMGVGPHRYVTQRRIERAKALLRAGGAGESLAAVALAVGFGEQRRVGLHAEVAPGPVVEARILADREFAADPEALLAAVGVVQDVIEAEATVGLGVEAVEHLGREE